MLLQYLPVFGPSESTSTADFEATETGQRVWKLLPNTVKPTPTPNQLPVVEGK